MLHNIRIYLDKVLEMNQIDVTQDEDDEDKAVYEKIECHLIGCLSVVCHVIKNNQDAKTKNVIIIMIINIRCLLLNINELNHKYIYIFFNRY